MRMLLSIRCRTVVAMDLREPEDVPTMPRHARRIQAAR